MFTAWFSEVDCRICLKLNPAISSGALFHVSLKRISGATMPFIPLDETEISGDDCGDNGFVKANEKHINVVLFQSESRAAVSVLL